MTWTCDVQQGVLETFAEAMVRPAAIVTTVNTPGESVEPEFLGAGIYFDPFLYWAAILFPLRHCEGCPALVTRNANSRF